MEWNQKYLNFFSMKSYQKKIKRLVFEFIEFATASLGVLFTDANHESILMGSVICLIGASLFTWAGGFQRMEREGVLTLGGPYQFVRHPWILARFLMVLGIIIMSRRPYLFIAAMLLLAPLYRKLAREEDQWTRRQLGPKADEYRALVAGFVPQFLPAKLPQAWRSTAQEGFSWTRALWKKPGRGALAFAGVCMASVIMWSWSVFPLSPLLWKGSVFLLIAGVFYYLWRDRTRML